MNNRFVTVFTATYGYEIAVLRGRLESEGIVCFVKDELSVQINPFGSNALGGVKLQVRESDLEQAIEILQETGYIKQNNSFSADEQNSTTGDAAQQPSMKEDGLCPICGSSEIIQIKKGGWTFLLTSLLLGCPTPFLKKKYYCFDCHREFKQ